MSVFRRRQNAEGMRVEVEVEVEVGRRGDLELRKAHGTRREAGEASEASGRSAWDARNAREHNEAAVGVLKVFGMLGLPESI